MSVRQLAAALVVVGAFLTIYLPDAGHGFIQDDFRWIVENRVHAVGDVAAMFTRNVGFYRPMVSLSFATDYALWNTNALGYGLTNIALSLIAALLLFLLARRLTLPPAASLVAVAVWLLNFHAVNMGVLWLSGRTALLACVFALLTALAAVSHRYLIAGVLTLLALLCKEETIALPAIVGAYSYFSDRRPASLLRTIPMWAAVAIYLALRLQSGAFWPGNAPSYYQPSLSPLLIARNVAEYADRAATVAVLTALVFAVVCRVRMGSLNAGEHHADVFGLIWTPLMFALTIFLPVRSSLYALLPSIGTSLVAAAVAAAAMRIEPRRFTRVAVVLLASAVLLIPVYRVRNARWVMPAELSERVMTTIARDMQGKTAGRVILIDDSGERFNLQSAFGNLFPEAMRLKLGESWAGEIVASGYRQDDATAIYRLANGNLIRQR